MLSPYGLEVVESCLSCQLRTQRFLCDLGPAALQAFEHIKAVTTYPKGAVLFVQGQTPRGIFLLCQGQVKLSMGSTDGRQLITRIAEAGDVMGLSATVSGKPYELTAETMVPCQVNFVKREDFLRFLNSHSDACIKVAEHLSKKYLGLCQEMRSLALSDSASQKLAQLLVEWCLRGGEANKPEPHLKIVLSREEISQMIGTSRETVTRTLRDFRKRQILQSKGATLVIRDKAALKLIATSN